MCVWVFVCDCWCKVVEGVNVFDVKMIGTSRVVARFYIDELIDVVMVFDVEKNRVSFVSVVKVFLRLKCVKGEFIELLMLLKREGESADVEDARAFEDEDNEMDEVSLGGDEGYIELMFVMVGSL